MDPSFPVRTLIAVEEVDSLSVPDLSDYFNPFLQHFMKEALRAGGEAVVSLDGGEVNGIFTFDVVEKVGSIFARDRWVAEGLFRRRDRLAIFSDFSFAPGAEAYQIFSVELSGPDVPHRFVHRVRVADESDRTPILRLIREMYGPTEESWLRSIPRAEEPCFLVEVGDQLAGVGWASVVNGHGRLHALSVGPRYRRMGVGTDLWHARMMWIRGAGARRVICEIAEHNAPSRSIAVAGGMRPVGTIFLSHRP